MESHASVLPIETLELLGPKKGEVFIDGTLGLGGHARLILEKISPRGKLIGLDADERNLEIARENLKSFPNIELRHANFRDLEKLVEPNSVDGILLDLGLSSPHLDDASRGFSFQNEGPLDFRFDQNQELTAAIILNSFPENEIALILREFGEIGISKKLARQICRRRWKKKFARTNELVELIEAKRLLPQVFQALRIAVNDELTALERALNSAPKLLKSGGRIAVISFHSLEDRIVKNFFREQKKSGTLEVLTKKPVIPSPEEIKNNPRARSAKLRAALKK
ncbi:MAG: 16S rRNA (cytosine(1402)-N(4))-methyltransferase RsmH [Candidatus Peribacteraceae bacterium]|nr:16S rRNA (cytosine(1402)-N(4))-methyltransferase RsmH [Candidatus Peribacteraceae bacterium]